MDIHIMVDAIAAVMAMEDKEFYKVGELAVAVMIETASAITGDGYKVISLSMEWRLMPDRSLPQWSTWWLKKNNFVGALLQCWLEKVDSNDVLSLISQLVAWLHRTCYLHLCHDHSSMKVAYLKKKPVESTKLPGQARICLLEPWQCMHFYRMGSTSFTFAFNKSR